MPLDYEAACKAAATAQGLDPLAAALDAAGVEYATEQTGGYCMTLTARTPLGVFAMVQDGLPMVGLFPGRDWYECGESAHDWTTSPEGFARFATVLSVMQAPTGPDAVPSRAVAEFAGLDGGGRYDWLTVLHAALRTPDAA